MNKNLILTTETQRRRGKNNLKKSLCLSASVAFSCILLLASCFLSPTLALALEEELPYSITDITSGEAVDFYPEFSRDGKQIVFSSKPLDGSYFTDMHLWIMDADGNNRRQITDKSAMYLQPTFTPDGEKVVFISNLEDGLWDIWSMKINGSGLTRLTKDNQKEFFPIVTSDGKNVISIRRKSIYYNFYRTC